MKKLLQIKRIALLLLLFNIIGSGAKGQNTCNNAITCIQGCTDYMFSASNSYWFTFVADTFSYSFKLKEASTNPQASITDFYLYDGNCGSLNVIDHIMNNAGDSISAMYTNLEIGRAYHILIVQNNTSNSYFKFCFNKSLANPWDSTDCPPPSCNLIRNGIFNPMAGTSPNDYQDAFRLMDVCGWRDAWRTPTLTYENNGNYSAWLFNQYMIYAGIEYLNCEGIYEYITLQNNINYRLSLRWNTFSQSSPTPELSIWLADDNMNQYFQPYLTTNGIPIAQLTQYAFKIVDTQLLNLLSNNTWVTISPITFTGNANYNKIIIVPLNYSANASGINIDDIVIDHVITINGVIHNSCVNNNSASIDITPSNFIGGLTYQWSNNSHTEDISGLSTGTYTVTVTDASGCMATASYYVQSSSPPALPVIVGNHNNCDANTTYSIGNLQPNCTYYWTIGNSSYSSSFPATANSLPVVWNANYTQVGQIADFTWLFVRVTNNNTGCIAKDSIKIWKCCINGDTNSQVNDEIINADNIINPGIIINGTITINLSLSPLPLGIIGMGPEAKIVVNPYKTFTITGTTIKSQCLYMWDGIYVTDSNAKVIIQADLAPPYISATVQDALNAIVSEKGGKFVLNNSRFYNNYISVLAKNNWWGPYAYPFPGYPHKGSIKKCIFSKNGSGLIRPYLGQKPMYGFYLDNIDRMQIGDSTVAGNTNIFRNLYCGIYSKNSGIKIVNNNFRRIKPTLPCPSQSPEVFTTLYCETAIFSIYFNPYGLSPINASSLICGGGLTTTRNTFDTCNNAIYTYQTATRLTKNKIYNTGLGIKCRDVISPSYITHSILKTNTPIGIQIINTLPTLTKVLVNYDTILEPDNGIYLTNIKSHATLASRKSVVRNNFVTLNKTGTIFGLCFENSDYIEAYCNRVKRSTLVPVADSLKNIGIRVDHCANANIHDNSCQKLSLGIKGSGNLSGATFYVNNIDSCYHGFYFETAYNGNTTVLTDQGIGGNPSDNKFTEYPGKGNVFRFAGALPTGYFSTWFFRSSGGAYLINIPVWHSLNSKIVPLGTTGTRNTVNCSSLPQGLMAGENLLNNMVSGTEAQTLNIAFNSNINFGVIDESMKYILQDNAFDVMKNMAQQPLLANSALTQQYSNIYNQMNNGNIGKFSSVLSLVNAGQIADAKNMNEGINPTNDIESNKQFAYHVYFDYIVPQLEIPSIVVDKLQIIADTPPCIGGVGVYVARAILGYIEPDQIINKSAAYNIDNNELSNNILIYPNPTSNELFVLFEGFEIGTQVKVEMYNVIGTLLLQKQIVCGNDAINISTDKIPAGCYVIVLKTGKKTLYKDRLVIIK